MSHCIWLRHETKPFEQRTPLTPEGACNLVQQGIEVIVERSPERAFPVSAYQTAGAQLVEANTWPQAPKSAIILGLKELPEADTPLKHKHIFFAHCYKGQSGSEALLRRFHQGGGEIYDLEFAIHENQRRIAAFGYWAGYVGAAIALLRHSFPGEAIDNTPIRSLGTREGLVLNLQNLLASKQRPLKVLIIGARGRCGTGAFDLMSETGVKHIISWDTRQTGKGGPFPELNEFDIVVNAVYLQRDIPPFVTLDSLNDNERQLTMISDVSCDPTSANNPIRIYDRITTMEQPLRIIDSLSPSLAVQAIDHLPSLLPLESSEEFADALFPHLQSLAKGETTYPWQATLDEFQSAMKSYGIS